MEKSIEIKMAERRARLILNRDKTILVQAVKDGSEYKITGIKSIEEIKEVEKEIGSELMLLDTKVNDYFKIAWEEK